MMVVGAARAEMPKLFADPSFVDTRGMMRQAGQDLPPAMLLPDVAFAEPYMPSKVAWPAEFDAMTRAAAAGRDVVVTGGMQSNGAIDTQAALVKQDSDTVSLWGAARHDHAHPYRDGGGDPVNFTYDRYNSQLAASWRPKPDARLSGFAMRDGFTDFRVPSYGIDAPRLERYIASSVYEQAAPESGFGIVQAGLTFDGVTYEADNVSLRDRGSLGMAYDGLWTTTRGLVRGQFDAGGLRHTVTADGAFLRFNIDVSNRFPSIGTSSFRIPQVETLQGGLTYSAAAALSSRDVVTGGLRLDAWHSQVGKRDAIPPLGGSGSAAFAVSPQRLWESYYGPGVDSTLTNLNVSARLNAQHTLEDGAGQVFVDLRRLVRNPDAGERFYANSGPASVTQVGNPGLSPEAHHRFEVGGRRDFAGYQGAFDTRTPAGAWRLSGSAYADRVMDFITADRARGQDGIYKSDKAIIYRNVEAYLAGMAGEGWWQAGPTLSVHGRVAWTRGENLSDDRPLYQVPPVEGEAVVEHRREILPDLMGSLGARVSFALSQNRIDASTASGSGEDTSGATAGWALFDLFGGLALGDRFSLTSGVSNLLDKRYHLHVNPMPQSPTTRFLEAPGRNFFLMGSVFF